MTNSQTTKRVSLWTVDVTVSEQQKKFDASKQKSIKGGTW